MSKSRHPKRNSDHHQARPNRHVGGSTPELPASVSEDEFFDQLSLAPGNPLVLLLDEVTDPHNLGACLRSANAVGALAILTPRHHSAPVTDTVIRVSCGAAYHTPVVSVTNLARAMKRLKDAGLWLIGTDERASNTLFQTDLRGPLGLVMGAEGSGLRRLTRESCDALIHIPMQGNVPCLNVSVAAGVCLFEALRQRHASE